MTILPDKTIRIEYSVIGVGAILLQNMTRTESVSSLWEKVKLKNEVNTFEKFISGMVVLFSIGAISYNNGIITKNKK